MAAALAHKTDRRHGVTQDGAETLPPALARTLTPTFAATARPRHCQSWMYTALLQGSCWEIEIGSAPRHHAANYQATPRRLPSGGPQSVNQTRSGEKIRLYDAGLNFASKQRDEEPPVLRLVGSHLPGDGGNIP